MVKKLYHFTARQHLKSILDTQELLVEGAHFIANPLKYPPQVAKELDRQYSITGRFVWFTENRIYNSSKNTGTHEPLLAANKNECGLIINADQIEVKKWHYIKRENKNNAEFVKLANQLDTAAKNAGDDPYDWWVSREAIDLRQVEFKVFYLED